MQRLVPRGAPAALLGLLDQFDRIEPEPKPPTCIAKAPAKTVSGWVYGQLTFPDLPDGYSIASCAGYATPVPIEPASWSSIKELFR